MSLSRATCVGWVASGRRSALGSRIVLGCCALHPLLYLSLEDPVSGFIIKRREIGVELPATRKYFCSKMREPNLIFGSFKILLETQSNGVAALRQPRFSICVYSSVVSLKVTYLISLASFLPCPHCVCTRMRDLTAYTCKALQELNQADVYAPRIRHNHATGGVVSHLIQVRSTFVFVCRACSTARR